MSMDTQAEPKFENGAFLYWLAGLTGLVGLSFAAWSLLDIMNPSAETGVPLVWVDMTKIEPGERKTVLWGSWPIYIVHRTPEEIAAVRADDSAKMPIPAKDSDRILREEWIVVVGVGYYCWLNRQVSVEHRGDWGGWIDVCRSDQYDLSGRVRNAWGRKNLQIPPYYFVGDKWIVIGDTS